MTLYVVLSRVQEADGLLLLRAFCPALFRLGEPPGPACFLKRLRARWQTEGQGLPAYTLSDACSEFRDRLERISGHRALRKSDGPEWKCGICEHAFPAEGFDATLDRMDEIRDRCEKVHPHETLSVVVT